MMRVFSRGNALQGGALRVGELREADVHNRQPPDRRRGADDYGE